MQDKEYLQAHGIMQQLEADKAALQAQVEALQGDVSRLTIENEQLKEQLATPSAADETAVIDEKSAQKSRTRK